MSGWSTTEKTTHIRAGSLIQIHDKKRMWALILLLEDAKCPVPGKALRAKALTINHRMVKTHNTLIWVIPAGSTIVWAPIDKLKP